MTATVRALRQEAADPETRASALERLLTLPEAAAACRCGQSTLRSAARKRLIGHTRVGRRLLFAERDVSAYLARRRIEAKPQ